LPKYPGFNFLIIIKNTALVLYVKKWFTGSQKKEEPGKYYEPIFFRKKKIREPGKRTNQTAFHMTGIFSFGRTD